MSLALLKPLSIFAPNPSRIPFNQFSSMMTCQKITDFSSYLTAESLRRKPSAIRALQPLLKVPGMISLGGGIPNDATFPISSIKFNLASVNGDNDKQIELSSEEVKSALQYGPTTGHVSLLNWFYELQFKEHNPHYEKQDAPNLSEEGLSMSLFNGSQDALEKAFDMLIDSGDTVLVESPVYSGTLAVLNAKHCNVVGVESDQNGLIPSSLREILEQISQSYSLRNHVYPGEMPVLKMPKFLYTVPTGSNPTGACTSLERKRQIYQICREYNLLILEDDPYYYLQFSATSSSDMDKHAEYNNAGRIPSYLSLDQDHRVLRFDSLSKVISPGMRLGLATGPKQLIDRLVLHSQCSSLHPNGLSQMIVWRTFKDWGINGFYKRIEKICKMYEQRRNLLDSALRENLDTKRISWHLPYAGMFIWLRVEGMDLEHLIKEKAIESKVILLPGVEFTPEISPISYRDCVRASYSSAKPEDMIEAVRRFSELLNNKK